MFDLSWGKLLLIGMVALIAIGPKDLPGVLRTVGQWMTKLRRMAAEFQGQFQEAMREAEMADLKKQVEGLADPVKSFTDLNPLETTRKELETAFDEKFTAPADAAPPAQSSTLPIAEPAQVAAAAPAETVAQAQSVADIPSGSVASADAPPAVPAEAVTQAPLDDGMKPQAVAAGPDPAPASAGRVS